jgi:hypothetical protein
MINCLSTCWKRLPNIIGASVGRSSTTATTFWNTLSESPQFLLVNHSQDCYPFSWWILRVVGHASIWLIVSLEESWLISSSHTHPTSISEVNASSSRLHILTSNLALSCVINFSGSPYMLVVKVLHVGVVPLECNSSSWQSSLISPQHWLYIRCVRWLYGWRWTYSRVDWLTTSTCLDVLLVLLLDDEVRIEKLAVVIAHLY